MKEVLTLDRNHLEIQFSEVMEKSLAEASENYAVVSGEGETLSIVSALLKPDGRTVHLTTDLQKEVEYIIVISEVKDIAGNEMKGGRKKFQGSLTRDQISPSVLTLSPSSGLNRVSPDTSIRITFSETMDTSSVRKAVFILPLQVGDPESSSGHDLPLQWSPSLSEVEIREEKGFQEGTVYWVYVTKGCRDISGNPLKASNSTSFTIDDSLPKGSLTGRVVLDDPKETLIGLLDFAGANSNSPLLLQFEVVQEEEGGFRLNFLFGGTYLLVGWREEEGLIYSGTYGPFELEKGESIEGISLSLGPDEEESPASVLKKFYPLMRSPAD